MVAGGVHVGVREGARARAHTVAVAAAAAAAAFAGILGLLWQQRGCVL